MQFCTSHSPSPMHPTLTFVDSEDCPPHWIDRDHFVLESLLRQQEVVMVIVVDLEELGKIQMFLHGSLQTGYSTQLVTSKRFVADSVSVLLDAFQCSSNEDAETVTWNRKLAFD